jgi:hypothetical protein
MRFESKYPDKLWDDSDPDYAPCLKKIRNGFVWICPAKYKTAGFPQKTFKLAGVVGDDQDHQRAAHARALTRSMLEWFDDEYHGREPGTWGWLIGRYKSDKWSQIHRVDPGTKLGYLKVVNMVENAICEVMIEDTNYSMMMGWIQNMETNGRTASFISRWFTHFGFVVSHGIKMEVPRCPIIKAIRSEMRFGTASQERQEFITRYQFNALVTKADEWSKKSPSWSIMSLAMMIRFEFGLRGTDIYGEWQPGNGSESNSFNGQVWVKGLEWRHFNRDMTSLSKVPSKTIRKKQTALTFDLNQTPEIRRRLLSIRGDRITGPVLINPATGRPPRRGWVSGRFNALRDACELPPELQIRDLRAGAATEADLLGAEDKGIQRMLGHSSSAMTNRYIREQDEAINKVIQLRQKGK